MSRKPCYPVARSTAIGVDLLCENNKHRRFLQILKREFDLWSPARNHTCFADGGNCVVRNYSIAESEFNAPQNDIYNKKV